MADLLPDLPEPAAVSGCATGSRELPCASCTVAAASRLTFGTGRLSGEAPPGSSSLGWPRCRIRPCPAPTRHRRAAWRRGYGRAASRPTTGSCRSSNSRRTRRSRRAEKSRSRATSASAPIASALERPLPARGSSQRCAWASPNAETGANTATGRPWRVMIVAAFLRSSYRGRSRPLCRAIMPGRPHQPDQSCLRGNQVDHRIHLDE